MSPEEILAIRAQQQAAQFPDERDSQIIGATTGALGGVLAGSIPHTAGNLINRLRGRTSSPLRGGFRMAGGLVGAGIGGLLGPAVREQMLADNRAAQVAGRVMATGELSESDRIIFEDEVAKQLSGIA